jgi:endonuclease G
MYLRLFFLLTILFICSCKRDRSKFEITSIEKDVTINNYGNNVTIIGSPDSHPNKTLLQESTYVDAKINYVNIPSNIPSHIITRIAYTASYNSKTRTPNWVSWHLTSEHTIGDYPRDNVYYEDEDVPCPRATDNDYRGSGWSRGHMCPAGDNKWNAKAMRESNLLTNICPQHASLNSGLWNVLERDCRRWAKKYGGVYIACGPLYYNKEHMVIGTNKVVVPEAFFKVILCLEGQPKGIGFVVKNNAGTKKKDQYVNTIDEVERITGYDFFSSLPDSIEEKVEAYSNINDWQ